jgi:hypothetical protein
VSNVLAGGWEVATIVRWQSGAPLSIRSSRGTFNRTGGARLVQFSVRLDF